MSKYGVFSGFVFSRIWIQMWENTDEEKILIWKFFTQCRNSGLVSAPFQSFCKRSEEKEDFCFLTLSFDTCSFRIVSTSFSTNSRSIFHALNFTLRIKAKLKLLSEVIKKLPKYHVGAYLG